MKAIEFTNYSFSYRAKTAALQQIDLSIPSGSFTVVTGPCGAGKTTLCMAINGLVPHYFGGRVAGEVRIHGTSTLNCKVSDLALKVGTVLEDYESQLVTMTVADEIAFGLENRGIAKEKIKQRTAQVLALVGLGGKEECETAGLSGGQKQRLAIAAVLATDAELLVLDEPASALDPEGSDELYALLHRLNREQGITVVTVEHELGRVLPYADQLVFMEGGSILKSGEPIEVLASIYHNGAYRDYVPALYQLKFSIEEMSGRQFPNWRSEQEAIETFEELLTRAQSEVQKSA